MSADHRTAQAKKWADDYLPPETCGCIDDVQNELEHMRDANSQLRHAAHFQRQRAQAAEGRALSLEAELEKMRSAQSQPCDGVSAGAEISMGLHAEPSSRCSICQGLLPNCHCGRDRVVGVGPSAHRPTQILIVSPSSEWHEVRAGYPTYPKAHAALALLRSLPEAPK